jgi:hypothetical protein
MTNFLFFNKVQQWDNHNDSNNNNNSYWSVSSSENVTQREMNFRTWYISLGQKRKDE